MLSIFDHTSGHWQRIRLFVDGILSLIRQWSLRPEFWNDVSAVPSTQAALDGLPSFCSLEPFRPRLSAVIHGVILTTTLFTLTCFAIRYSWIHVLQIHIPGVQSETSAWEFHNPGPGSPVAANPAQTTPAPPRPPSLPAAEAASSKNISRPAMLPQ